MPSDGDESAAGGRSDCGASRPKTKRNDAPGTVDRIITFRQRKSDGSHANALFVVFMFLGEKQIVWAHIEKLNGWALGLSRGRTTSPQNQARSIAGQAYSDAEVGTDKVARARWQASDEVLSQRMGFEVRQKRTIVPQSGQRNTPANLMDLAGILEGRLCRSQTADRSV